MAAQANHRGRSLYCGLRYRSRLRTKVYKDNGGKAYVYYNYDMRKDGKPDIHQGSDHAKALLKWDEPAAPDDWPYRGSLCPLGGARVAQVQRRHLCGLPQEPAHHPTGVWPDALG